jgi:hypothetical protein
MAELSDFSGILGQDVYTPLFDSLGYSNWNDEGNFYTNEGGNIAQQDWTPSADAYSFINSKGLDFGWTPDGDGGGELSMTGPGGLSNIFRQKGDDDFTKLVGMVAPAIASWGFGGALSGMFGGGVTGGALGHGLASGSITKAQGGDFGKGFLGGAVGGGLQGLAAGTPAVMGNNPSAYVPATPGTSIAGSMGIANPTLAGMVNRGAGSALGTLATGGNGSDVLRSGVTGAALSGLNSVGKMGMNYFKDSLNSWLAPETTQADYSTGDTSYGSNYMAPGQGALRAAGLFPEMSNVPPSSSNFTDINSIGLPSLEENVYANASYGEQGYRPVGANVLEEAGLRDGMSYATPGTSGDISSNFLGDVGSFGAPMGQQFAQSAGPSEFSLPSVFGNVGSRMGNFALNNAGDLASMLYGFYNNRRQQKALGQQVSSLQGLYGQNSPYAAQLRNQLNAKAAASGRRSNVAGRETQLQAQLADRAASMAPTLMQLNQARGGLKNNNMNMLLQGANKMGLFSNLGSLFNQNPMSNYSMANNTNDYNLLGMMEGSR